MKKLNILCLVLSALLISTQCVLAEEPWKELFDGKTLAGWTQTGGAAQYSVRDGQIIGKSVMDTPNSFLCTNYYYSDFILELEFKVDSNLNSGIQIRSNSFPEYDKGRVHGYQIEIDPSKRAWSGGIYDEARRGWLHTLENNPEAQKAFKTEQWNTVRVEAIGDTLKTWINGIPAAHLCDTMTRTGFIALQVHGIGKDKSKEGTQVCWRHIRIIDQSPASFTRPMPLPIQTMDNQLGNVEKDQGFKLLFDGKTSGGWTNSKMDQFPTAGWVIQDGVLTVLDDSEGGKDCGGDIMTTGRYKDFELHLDFKVAPGANSGIKYFVDPDIKKGTGISIGLEYQILDDARHQDARLGFHKGSRAVGSLYDLIDADYYIKSASPIGQWNHAALISKGNHVEHWLNGRKILEYERKTPEFQKLIAESKYKDWGGFGQWESGHILLQDHGNTVSFKNIKIREPK